MSNTEERNTWKPMQKVDRNKRYDLEDGNRAPEGIRQGQIRRERGHRHPPGGRTPSTRIRWSGERLPFPTEWAKTVSVLVFAKGEKEKEAQEAGADFVGAEDLVEKITGGWTDFDKAIATPDMMGTVGKLGKILGPGGSCRTPRWVRSPSTSAGP